MNLMRNRLTNIEKYLIPDAAALRMYDQIKESAC